MPRHFVFLPIIVVSVAVAAARAAEKPTAKSQEGEIRQAIAALEGAFNRGDAKGVAACWTPDGEFLGPGGELLEGREKIEAAYQGFLATHRDSKLQLKAASVRLVTDDVALADLVALMTPAPEELESEPGTSMVLVKRDGRWLIGSMRETLGSTPSPYLHLKGLQWLVGEWSGEAAGNSGVAVRSTCDWTARGSYLIRRFTREGIQGVELAGTEVIGWDPRTHQIRSWTFDADGSFGESKWTRDGDHWIIQYAGTRSDGSDVAATHVVTVVDANTLTLQSKDRVVDGQRQPDLPVVTVKRRAAENGAKSKAKEPAGPPRQVLP